MSRRRARITAFKALYEADTAGHPTEQVIARLLEEYSLPPEAEEFARELVTGVERNREQIDEIIQRYAPAFPISQLSPVDRNILRLAIFEILFDNKVPVAAAINEAVELAKKFGSDSTRRFVNGVLGSVARERR